jgi:hypothetical protein
LNSGTWIIIHVPLFINEQWTWIIIHVHSSSGQNNNNKKIKNQKNQKSFLKNCDFLKYFSNNFL